jgi:hypothetical protein
MPNKKSNLTKVIICGIVMAIGLFLFKFIPMKIWGKDILFDASMHITLAIFCLYIVWFFIDQNKGWQIPYFIFGAVVITIISLQRIISNAHNDVGLLMGVIISTIGILIAEGDIIKKLRWSITNE